MKTKNIIIAGLIMCLGIAIGGAGVYAGSASNLDWVTVDEAPGSYSTSLTELSLTKIDMTSSPDTIEMGADADTFNTAAGADTINTGADDDKLFLGFDDDYLSFGPANGNPGNSTDVAYLIFNPGDGETTTPPNTGTWIKHDNTNDNLEIRVSTGKLIIRLGD